MKNPSCAFCSYAYWEEDMSVGIWGHWECDCPDMTDEDIENLDMFLQSGMTYEMVDETMAANCSHYISRIWTKPCAQCGTPMLLPEDEIEFYAMGWEATPVCSAECQEKYEDYFDKEMKKD